MLNEIKKNEKGFTLVELIVVIAIMAVLSALLIPRIMGNVADASKQKEITTAQTLASEITIYNAQALADDDDTTNPIAAGQVTASTISGIPALALPTGTTFPKDTVVKIYVDAKYAAHIEKVTTP